MFFTVSSFAQLLVIDTVPQDGATNVSLTSVIQFTFSEAIHTTARYEFPGEFYLGVFVQPNLAVWAISYSADQAETETACINAVTGQFLVPPVPQFSTARSNLNAANQAAVQWAGDARLIMVSVHSGMDQLLPSGLAMFWSFIYHSASMPTDQEFIFSNGQSFGSGPLGWPSPSQQELPVLWIDSDEAMTVAEIHGGLAYRTENLDAWILAELSYNLAPGDPGSLVWAITYASTTADAMTLWIDALTGAIYTGVADNRMDGVPQTFKLEQNYPNPFNLPTAIEYDLPKASHVRLVIYNLLGRSVKTLVDTHGETGHFQTTWDGTDKHNLPVAAGVYFCRMQAWDAATGSAGSSQTSTPNKSGQSFVKVIKLALVK